jgi:hypothetical protein
VNCPCGPVCIDGVATQPGEGGLTFRFQGYPSLNIAIGAPLGMYCHWQPVCRNPACSAESHGQLYMYRRCQRGGPRWSCVPATELRCSGVVWAGAGDKSNVDLTQYSVSGGGGNVRDSWFLVAVGTVISSEVGTTLQRDCDEDTSHSPSMPA